MDNKAFAKELEQRTRKFAIAVLKLSAELPDTAEGRVIRGQISKAGTSIGANYREANRARSRADFINKVKICESESSETQYWIEVIANMGWLSWDRVREIYTEGGELLALFSSIGKRG